MKNPFRQWLSRIGAGLLLASAIACNDRTSPLDIVIAPGVSDAGADADVNSGVVGPPDPRCNDVPDGASCDVVSGAGVCVLRQCVLVACAIGFDDCNGEESDGCESDLRTDEACGACASACEGNATCQLGRAGWGCSAGSLCPADRFELDGDPEPLCEISATWLDRVNLAPFDLVTELATLEHDEPTALGRVGDLRAWMNGVRSEEFENLPAPPGPALDVARDESRALWGLLWADMLVLTTGVGTSEEALRDECQNVADFVGVSIPRIGSYWLIATTRDIIVYSDGACERSICEVARFGPAEFLATFRPDPASPQSLTPFLLDAGEMSACDSCLFGPPGRLAVPAACVEGTCQNEPSIECGGCSSVGCPTFEPVSIVASKRFEDRIYVLTKRGVVGLSVPDFEPVFRAERTFEGTVSGRTFEAIAVVETSAGEVLRLVRANGEVSSILLDDATPVSGWSVPHPPLIVEGLDASRLRAFHASEWGGLVADESGTFLMGLGGLTKAALLTAESAPGGGEFDVVGVDGDGTLIYEVSGQLLPRTFENALHSENDSPPGGGL